ncbi:hypothetical protein F2Q69_00034366 [Brassica cretica]|uniref:Uncharacterized protein n=1 Tax=Brassica cretica TaxID=69181 RepID=A0A8S9SIT3_BRACR|nr:hypothetical protein F2Q69_00034366 [Brassica cretica]
MGDHDNQDDLTAALAIIQQQMQTQQQQMLQIQQTIQNQQQAAQEVAENATREERDDLTAKVDQLLKGNQSQVFIMEEAALEKSAGDLAFDAEISGDDQQEQDKPADPAQSNQGQYAGYQNNYQPRIYVISQPQNNPPQMQKHQNTQPATSAPVAVPQDEVKAMLQQLLQGQQLQGKALNHVTTEINTIMNHMFNELSTKYDNIASHMRQMDIQIAQTAESVKRQQSTLPGKTDKNPKECNAVELRSGKQLSEPVNKRFTAAENGKQKESEQPPADTPTAEKEREPTVGTNSPGPEQPAEAVRPIPEPVPAREYTPKVPYPIPAKATRKDREEMKCKKMLEDLTVRLPLMDVIQMMSSMRSFMKGLISGKISEESEFMTVSKDEEILTEDPLDLALVRAEAEQSVENIDVDGPFSPIVTMPPRTKKSPTGTRKTNNTPPQRAQQPTSASYPWPREQEDEPINLDDPMLLYFNCEGWDKETASRMYSRRCKLGIAPLCYATHELYPDHVRQVLATATISYEDFSAPSYANCSFSFMADGEYCSLSLDKLNEIYEIANEPRGVAVAKKFAPSNTFWDFIANGSSQLKLLWELGPCVVIIF